MQARRHVGLWHSFGALSRWRWAAGRGAGRLGGSADRRRRAVCLGAVASLLLLLLLCGVCADAAQRLPLKGPAGMRGRSRRGM